MEIKAKIGFTLKGIYCTGVIYDILDVVTYNNALYISTVKNNDTDPRSLDCWQEAIHGVNGITEDMLNDILNNYWSKQELYRITDEYINNLIK